MKKLAGNYRYRLYDKNTLLVQRGPRDVEDPGHVAVFLLDGKELPCELAQEEEITYRVNLPAGWEKGRTLLIADRADGKDNTVSTIAIADISGDLHRLFFNIEGCRVADGNVWIQGWVLGSDVVEIRVLDKKGALIDSSITRSHRPDVFLEYDNMPVCSADFPGDGSGGSRKEIEAGFRIKFPADAAKSFQICFICGGQTKTFQTTAASVGRHSARMSVFRRFRSYLCREGWGRTIRRILCPPKRADVRTDYSFWYKSHKASKRELKRQRQEIFAEPVTFSIAVPLYRTKESYLKELVESVLAQTYPHWELCLADGSGREHSLEEAVRRFAGGDPRIRYRLLDGNLGIAANTNAAIEMSSGGFIVLADHDDILAPDALYECAVTLRKYPGADVVYTDEDKIDMSGREHFDPNFKPDFNPDFLYSINYICHMFVAKRSLMERVGLLRQEFDGAQDYDFILRCCEQASLIRHIPRILYHWRCHMDSTSFNQGSKLYAFEAGRRAVEAHYQRLGIPARVENTDFLGMYRTVYHWDETPLVSILIPNKDHVEDLRRCLDSIDEKSLYRNYEYIIIENNSTEEGTFRYYEELERRPNVTVVKYQGLFNFSRINNFGEQYAKGEYLLLLNNDTEMMDGNCLQEMLGYCMREDVGIVGARLLYEDDTIQHAGVVIGLGGIAGHTFVGAERKDEGYQKRLICAQNYSAVTAACLMVKRGLYEEVGGLTEELEVAFNDIDFCLKVRELGKLVVYNPYAQLYHFESKSRGYEDTPEKVRRFQGEIAKFQKRWGRVLQSGDPYYNPNLTLSRSDFSLASH